MPLLSREDREIYVPVGRDRNRTFTESKCFELLLFDHIDALLDFTSHTKRDIAIKYRLDNTFLNDYFSFDLTISFVVHFERNLAKGPRTIDSSIILSSIENVVIYDHRSTRGELA